MFANPAVYAPEKNVDAKLINVLFSFWTLANPSHVNRKCIKTADSFVESSA